MRTPDRRHLLLHGDTDSVALEILQSRRSTVVSKSQEPLHRVGSEGARIYGVGHSGISATSTVRGVWKHRSSTPSPAISPAPSPVVARKGSTSGWMPKQLKQLSVPSSDGRIKGGSTLVALLVLTDDSKQLEIN
ncbi:hypothetical protein LSAT2_023522 [Lamellibrachia satsuma]|nr:hypothetical protein LSAT2_023522 [Lamellibrachia satsuma]